MRRALRFAVAGLLPCLLGVAVLADGPAGKKATKPSEKKIADDDCGCGDYGTTVQFHKSPSDAAKKAEKTEKLVFVLHVSGDFENSDLT